MLMRLCAGLNGCYIRAKGFDSSSHSNIQQTKENVMAYNNEGQWVPDWAAMTEADYKSEQQQKTTQRQNTNKEIVEGVIFLTLLKTFGGNAAFWALGLFVGLMLLAHYNN
jgi:hypothetical protein